MGGDGIAPADVVEVLTRLVDKSLVVAEQRVGETRYRLLDPVRQYAAERLARAGGDTAVRRRHTAYYGKLALRAEWEL